jgi:hypothetical protein
MGSEWRASWNMLGSLDSKFWIKRPPFPVLENLSNQAKAAQIDRSSGGIAG